MDWEKSLWTPSSSSRKMFILMCVINIQVNYIKLHQICLGVFYSRLILLLIFISPLLCSMWGSFNALVISFCPSRVVCMSLMSSITSIVFKTGRTLLRPKIIIYVSVGNPVYLVGNNSDPTVFLWWGVQFCFLLFQYINTYLNGKTIRKIKIGFNLPTYFFQVVMWNKLLCLTHR